VYAAFLIVLLFGNIVQATGSPGVDVMDLMLFGRTIDTANEASATALLGNRSFSPWSFDCDVHALEDSVPYALFNVTDVLGTEGVDITGVHAPAHVFDDACSALLVAEPEIQDGWGERWIPERFSARMVTGCSARPVNGSWVDFRGQRGGGYHREFLTAIGERTQVLVDGQVCHDSRAYRGNASSFDVQRVYCHAKGAKANVSVEHSCMAYVLVDSAYYVLGWKALCDEDSIETLIADRCKKSACLSGSPSSPAARACARACEAMARVKARTACMPRASERALCPTEVSPGFHGPESGSSDYQLMPPGYTDYCKRFCTVVDDPGNSCFNNRVWKIAGERAICEDRGSFMVSPNIDLSCSGGFEIRDGIFRASIVLRGQPEITAIILGGIPHRRLSASPLHRMYALDGGLPGGYVVNVSMADDGSLPDLSNRLGFASLELLPNAAAPAIGGGFQIDGGSWGNSTFEIMLSHRGIEDPLEDTLYAVTAADRVAALSGPVCGHHLPCPKDSVCMDGHCMQAGGLFGLKLGDCLEEWKKTELEGRCEGGVCAFTLSAEGGPVSGAIDVECLPAGGGRLHAGADGMCEMEIEGDRSCIASFGGDGVHGPSSVMVRTGPDITFPAQELLLAFGPLFLLACAATLAGGGKTLLDLWRTIRGWMG